MEKDNLAKYLIEQLCLKETEYSYEQKEKGFLLNLDSKQKKEFLTTKNIETIIDTYYYEQGKNPLTLNPRTYTPIDKIKTPMVKVKPYKLTKQKYQEIPEIIIKNTNGITVQKTTHY